MLQPHTLLCTHFNPKYRWSCIVRQWTPVVASVIKMHLKPPDTMLCYLYCSQQLHIQQTMAACLNWYSFHSLSMHSITNVRWDIQNITMSWPFCCFESILKTPVSLLDLSGLHWSLTGHSFWGSYWQFSASIASYRPNMQFPTWQYTLQQHGCSSQTFGGFSFLPLPLWGIGLISQFHDHFYRW
jgi:hypothetical protein